MDEKTTIAELKLEVKKFCEDRDWDRFHNPKDLAIGVVDEACEILEHFRFRTEEECESYMHEPKKKTAIADEIVDVLYMLLRFSQKYDIDLTSEFRRKMKENALKYPIEKCKGKNNKYNEL